MKLAKTKRPFEVNDFVVLQNGFVGHLKTWNEVYFLIGLGGKNTQVMDWEIKTIRKPRPGNAESRNIVAALCNEWLCYVSDVLFLKAGSDKAQRKIVREETKKNSSYYRCYQLAKAMLK